ncbi:acetyltransferase [Spirochaeta lutea]|uniref:acetyltransferase n=1 Tax=Spirochaeta lutea TaxID=1480694 RepID=UPI0009DDBE41|nr:acetyltransferase [Spirochaeta lutea]
MTVSRRVILIGYFDEIVELIGEDSSLQIVGYTDLVQYGDCEQKYLGSDQGFLMSEIDTSIRFVVSPDSPRIRKKLFESYYQLGMGPQTVISDKAYISKSAKLGNGSLIQRFSSVSSNSTLGNGVRLNYYANVTHNVEIGDYSVLAPGCTVLGGSKIGNCTYIGANAVIHPKVQIGSNVIIGAGANVTRNIPDNVIAYGNPAKIQRMNDA